MLTGGTGFIGSAVLDHLVDAGHQVTAAVRNQSSSLAAEKAGAVAVIGDLFDTTWLASELRTHDALIHTAGGNENDATLNDAVIDAALSAFSGTSKPFVHTGGIWMYGSNPSISETSTVAPPTIAAWRPAGEQRLLASGIRASVVQPGIVYGHGSGIPAQVARGGPLPGTGEQRWTTVHVEDLADLYLRALDAPGGQSYIGASGQNPTVREIGEALGGNIAFAGDEATRENLGAFGEALLLDQAATGAKAKSLGWQPSRPSLIEELATGYPDER